MTLSFQSYAVLGSNPIKAAPTDQLADMEEVKKWKKFIEDPVEMRA